MSRPGSRFQVPGGVRNPAWRTGGGMRHRGGAKCACRVDPSTSGGAAENTSSMYACNPPEGPSMCQRAQNRSPYYFTPTVAGSSSRDSYVHTCNELLDQFLDPSCNPVARSLNTKHPVPLRHVGSSRHQATRRDTTPQGHWAAAPDPELTSPTRSYSRLLRSSARSEQCTRSRWTRCRRFMQSLREPRTLLRQ